MISYSFLIRFDIQKLNIRIPLSTQPIQEQLSAMKEMGEEMKNPQPDSMFRSDNAFALIGIDWHRLKLILNAHSKSVRFDMV